jgi:hypothetical protein
MTPEFRQLVIDRDEAGLERLYFESECPHFFAVDWREDDADIVEYCADCLGLTSLTAEWRDEDLVVSFEGRELKVPLIMDVADRHITICTLNDLLSPNYQIRFLVFSHGSDTLGLAALSAADWQSLEKTSPAVVAENFIDPRNLPNLMTELTEEKLPPNAQARFQRMLERNKRESATAEVGPSTPPRMTFDQLIQEGRRLERPCVFLRPVPNGRVAAVWYERDNREIESTGHRRWLSLDARQIPDFPSSINGCITVFTNETKCESGRLELTSSWPNRPGTKLYAYPASVLPPIDAVFARGSEAVGDWIQSHGWNRTDRYSDGFPDAKIVQQYEQVWMTEFPIYFESDIYAVLGGWHFPCADQDWHDLLDEQLMVFTLRDSEPWVEVWRKRSGKYKVIQRIT